jgi:alpha-glucosidase
MCGSLQAKDHIVTSPNGKNVATVDDALNIRVAHNGKQVVTVKASLRDGLRIASVKSKSINETIQAPFYRQKEIRIAGNQLDVKLNDGFSLQIRAYDEGVAYRFSTTNKKQTIIYNETADFSFPEDSKAWLAYSTNDEKPFAMAFQNFYDETLLSKAKDKYIFLPATIQSGGVKVTILESDLRAYPGMFMKADGLKLRAAFAKYPKTLDRYPWRGMTYVADTEDYIAKSTGARTYPWRVMAITEKDTEMPVNNLVYALATPNQIGDTSWIRPGKVAWDWWNDWGVSGVDFAAGINMDTYKYYIDFAAKYGLSYIILDEGWFKPSVNDMLTVIPELNLPELVAYGKQKGVRIILWTIFNVLDDNLDKICKTYSDMGIAGFKADFLDRDDQEGVEMIYRIAEVCAKYHLMLDYHGIYKPTGINRTYPNIVNPINMQTINIEVCECILRFRKGKYSISKHCH